MYYEVMEMTEVVQTIDHQIELLQKAKALLTDTVPEDKPAPYKKSVGRPRKEQAPSKPKKQMSEEGRKKIAEAQKARWAAKREAKS